jgi:hypothetical protein
MSLIGVINMAVMSDRHDLGDICWLLRGCVLIVICIGGRLRLLGSRSALQIG